MPYFASTCLGEGLVLLLEGEVHGEGVEPLASLDELLDALHQPLVLRPDAHRRALLVRPVRDGPADRVLVRDVQDEALLAFQQHRGEMILRFRGENGKRPNPWR